jgi:predicted nucleic acid-binding protein
MTYLLDVNVLLAICVRDHESHQRTTLWAKRSINRNGDSMASCAITELGFLRILLQVPWYGFSMPQGKRLLAELKSTEEFKWTFLEDNRSATELPKWVTRPKQITDGHLLGLARAHGGMLATLDKGIPGALLIPD